MFGVPIICLHVVRGRRRRRRKAIKSRVIVVALATLMRMHRQMGQVVDESRIMHRLLRCDVDWTGRCALGSIDFQFGSPLKSVVRLHAL